MRLKIKNHLIVAIILLGSSLAYGHKCGRLQSTLSSYINTVHNLFVLNARGQSHTISDLEKSHYFLRTEDGKTQIPVGVIDISTNYARDYSVLLKAKQELAPKEIYKLFVSKNGKEANINFSKNELKVRQKDQGFTEKLIIEAFDIKYAPGSELGKIVKYVTLKTNLKLDLVKINIKNLQGKTWRYYVMTDLNGTIFLGAKACSRNFAFETDDKYEISLSTLNSDGEPLQSSNSTKVSLKEYAKSIKR